MASSRVAGRAFTETNEDFVQINGKYLKEETHTTIDERERRVRQYEHFLSSFFQDMQKLYHFRLHSKEYNID